MSYKDALKTPPTKRVCKFATWLDTLDEEDRTAVHEALADKAWSVEALVKVLSAEGASLYKDIVRKHRLGICVTCNNQ